jgi:hypothetical protein
MSACSGWLVLIRPIDADANDLFRESSRRFSIISAGRAAHSVGSRVDHAASAKGSFVR